MYIGVACADDDAVVAIEQQIAVETIGPGLHSRRHRSVVNVVFDFAVHPVDRSCEKRAQNEREQHPILDEDIDGQSKEIETNVLLIERVVCAIWHVIEKLQEDTPVA